jgi:pimeloyl-ACP methyl ester carboxylesterase
MSKDNIPKGYVSTDAGQVHYRRLTPDASNARGECVILLHWLPLSSRMYQYVMPILYAHGYDVIAFDLLGYGRSDPRPETWSMAQWATSIEQAARNLDIEMASVLGGHSGACVAAELALCAPDLVTKIMLDGCPFLTPELKAVFQGMAKAPRPSLKDDHSHEKLAFGTVATTFAHYIPSFRLTNQSLEMIWPAMIDYLETDFVSSAPISGAYDLDLAMPNITQPLLLLGAATDTLASNFPRACELVPTARQHFFEGDHPIHFPERTQLYTAPILNFLETV